MISERWPARFMRQAPVKNMEALVLENFQNESAHNKPVYLSQTRTVPLEK